MKSSVTISMVPELKGGPWIYHGDLEGSIIKASELGFDAIEIFTKAADQINHKYLAKLLQQNGLRLSAAGTGAGKVLQGLSLTSDELDIRKRALQYISEMIEFAEELNASVIIGSMQGRIQEGQNREDVLKRLRESFIELAGKAVQQNVTLIYEPLNRYETNIINQLSDAVTFIKSLGADNVVLLADLFHMNIEEISITDSLRRHASCIGHIHLADSNRRPAGMGHIHMQDVATVLGETGYDGYLSAEALPYPDSDTAARETIAVFNRYFTF